MANGRAVSGILPIPAGELQRRARSGVFCFEQLDEKFATDPRSTPEVVTQGEGEPLLGAESGLAFQAEQAVSRLGVLSHLAVDLCFQPETVGVRPMGKGDGLVDRGKGLGEVALSLFGARQ